MEWLWPAYLVIQAVIYTCIATCLGILLWSYTLSHRYILVEETKKQKRGGSSELDPISQ